MAIEKSDCGLIVFLRLPVLGRVKTRLAATIGHDEALRIYKELIGITLQIVAETDASVYLFYDGGLPPNEERIPMFSYHHQVEGLLGNRMTNALSNVLTKHKKAVIIGSDCPGISSGLINKSFKLLDDCDVVLGPSQDGGYYLFGCNHLTPSLFDEVMWSTASVLDQTLEKIKEARLTCQLLEALMDIDTESDWEQYLMKVPSS